MVLNTGLGAVQGGAEMVLPQGETCLCSLSNTEDVFKVYTQYTIVSIKAERLHL